MLTNVSLCAGTLVSTVASAPFAAGMPLKCATTIFSASATGMSPTTTTAI